MRIEMGRATKKDRTNDDALRKQTVGVDETKSKDGAEARVVQQQREVIESKQGHHRGEIDLQEREGGGVDWEKVVTETEENERASKVSPGSEHSSLNEQDKKMRENILERPKSCSGGKGFITSNFQDVSQPESLSRNTYVKLWAHKESHRNDQSPKRIKVKIGSLSCGDTVRFLEADKVRVIKEIRAEHEKRLESARDTKLVMGTADNTSEEVEDTKEMASYPVRNGKEAKGLQSDEEKRGKMMEPEERGRGQTQEEPKRVEDRAAEINDKQWTERDETCSQELKSRPMSDGRVIQKADKELRNVHETTVQKTKQKEDQELKVAFQPKANATLGTRQEDQLVGAVTDQVPASREQADAKGPKRDSTRLVVNTVKKNERRTVESPKENKGRTATLHFHPTSSVDSRSYKLCQGDKWATRFEKCSVGSAKAGNWRAAKQGEGEDEEHELQNRALFHLEALRRIEEIYNNRRNRVKRKNFRSKHSNEIPLRHPGCWDNNYYSGVHETQNHQLGKLQKKGKGGLNALLAPVFEEESDQNSPTNSYEDKEVLIFRRMKKARLRSAEEQIAAAKATAKQRRVQKATPNKTEQARALEQESDRKEKKIGGECFKAQKDSLSAKKAEERLSTSKPSSNCKAAEQPVKSIKELNEKAKAEDELEGERRTRANVKDEERRTRLRKGAPNCASVELYSRLSKNDRRENSGLRLAFNSRFKSPPARSQKLFSYNGLQHPRFSAVEMNNKFRSPVASPRKDMKCNALDHFAKWDKELRTSQRSKSRSKERSRERTVSIWEDKMQHTGKMEDPGLKRSSREKALVTTYPLCNKEQMNKSPPRNQSPVNLLRNEAIPDHYNSVEEGCTCEVKYKKEMKEKTGVKFMDEKTKQTGKRARRKENCQSLNWLGKLYNTITSLG